MTIILKLISKSQMAVARLRTFSFNDDKLQQALEAITLSDLNVALCRCDREEVEDERSGVYDIPGWRVETAQIMRLPGCHVASQ